MTKSKGGYRLNKYFTVSESEQFAFYKARQSISIFYGEAGTGTFAFRTRENLQAVFGT